MKRNTFILKCFLQFTCTNLDGCQKEWDNFLNLLQKEGCNQKRGGFQPWRKLCIHKRISMMESLFNKVIHLMVCNFIKKRQKQLARGVLRKKFSEIMQQIYRRTPMQKYDFNKFVLQFYWYHTLAWVLSSKCAAYFQNIFS